ncbi:MAG: RsmB/NOP family class I SAM-dependent RNA methyltransferase [Armatimonadetes bacterium]|nr:RsmB/NOP family class I SAM-dependent RNA methyltransferase [Armatimonadota bacterium]
MSKKKRPERPTGPGPLMVKSALQLFPDDEERRQFIQALLDGVGREQSIIILQEHPAIRVFPRLKPESWQPSFVERLDPEFRPGKHPLYEKGNFYSLDFSSVFSCSAMLAIKTPPARVLDLCSAPGGKSVFAYRAFKPEILVCNETIRKRCSMLIGNLERCHIETARVWSADPSVYANRWPQCFDLVIVDAPCSGQSLLAKGEPAPGAFTPSMIDMNVGRQRRISGNAYKCLRAGGHIFYSTCTFSPKENEKLIAWLLAEYDDLETVEIPALAQFQSRYADFNCYRMFPHYGLGAGAFVCLVRKKGEPPAEYPPMEDLTGLWWYGKPPVDPVVAAKRREDQDKDKDKPKRSGTNSKRGGTRF